MMKFNHRSLGELIYLLRFQTEKIYSKGKKNILTREDHFQVYFVPDRGIIVKKEGNERFNEKMDSLDYRRSLKIPEEIFLFESSKHYRKHLDSFFNSLGEKSLELINPTDNFEDYDEYSHKLKKLTYDFERLDSSSRENLFKSYLREYKSLQNLNKKEQRFRKKLGFKKNSQI